MIEEEKEHQGTEQGKQARTEQYSKPRFMELVLSVGAGALQALGVGLGTEEDEPEPNLVLARYSIDLLELLGEKTKGNLAEEEDRFLTEMLHKLRMKYVEVSKTKERDEQQPSEPGQ